MPESFHKFPSTPHLAWLGAQPVRGDKLLAPDEVDALLRAELFPRNSDSNRFLEYATPRYNLSRAPHEQMNLRALGRYAKFPPLEIAGAVAPEIRALLAGVTPELQRRKFELDAVRP